MPRIPQGKFRTEPSTDIGSERFRKVKTGLDAAKGLRQMGQGYTAMANKVADAKQTADALSLAEKQEAKYETQLSTDIDEIKKNSVNGMYKDSTGNEISTSQAINNKINQFESGASGELDENSKMYYDRYLKPKLDQQRLQAEAFETKQIVDHRKDALDIRKKGIVAKFKETGNVDLELMEYNDVSLQSSKVVGREHTENEITDLHRKLAYSATDVIRRNGFTPETDRMARKYMSALPKAERQALEMNYNRVAKEVQIAQKKTAYKNADTVIASLESTKHLDANRGKIAELNKMFYNTPISSVSGETAQERLSKASKLTGKQIAIMAQGINQALSPEQYQAAAEQIYNELAQRGLASSELAQTVGEDNLKQAVMTQAFNYTNSFVDKRDNILGGAFELAVKNDPSINERLATMNPVMTEGVLQQLNATFDSQGIPQDMRTLTSPEAAKALGKEFDELSKGAADPTGDVGYGKLMEIKQMYGSQANKAMRDYITLGSGTKKGETRVPPVTAIAIRMQDEAFGREIMGAKSLYKKNYAKLKDEGLHKDLDKAVNDAFVDSNLQNLYYGRNGEGVALYEGSKEAIQSLAAELMAGEEKLSAAEAVDIAKGKLDGELRVGKSDVHRVLVDKDFMDKVDVHENALNGMARRLGDLDNLDKVNANIDYDALSKMATNNEFLKRHSDLWKKAGKLGYEEQQNMIMKVLKDNIMVSNDPDRPNTAKIYIKPTYGRPIPMPMKGAEGTEDMRVDLMDYYQVIQNERMQRANARTTGSSMSRFNKMAQ